MPVKIRLQRQGRKKKPFYQIIVADARAPRDGKFIDNIGNYNPMTKPATIELDIDRAYDWLMKGAQPTDTARAILRFKGVLYKKHLLDGVKKGALTTEQAEAKLQSWVDAKQARVSARFAQTAAEEKAWREKISGEKPKIVVKEVVEEVVAPTADVAEVEVVVEAPATEVEVPALEAVEEAPAAEAEVPAVETPAQEAPAAETEAPVDGASEAEGSEAVEEKTED